MATRRYSGWPSSQPKILERAFTQINMKVIDRTTILLGLDGIDGFHIKFSILGNTGKVYSVIFNLETNKINQSDDAVSCTCPYFSTHNEVCKHIYLVYIKVFRIIPEIISSLPELSLEQRRLLVNLYKNYVSENITPPITSIESRSGPDDECPVCFDKLVGTRTYVCHKCRNSIHNDCIREVIKYNKHCPLCRGDIMDSLVGMMEGMHI